MPEDKALLVFTNYCDRTLPLHFDIRFIHAPRSICVSFLRVSFCCNGWRITDNPTIERSMININPSFFHDLFKVAIRNAIPDIKENRIKNNVFGKVCPFKADHDFILCTLGNKGGIISEFTH